MSTALNTSSRTLSDDEIRERVREATDNMRADPAYKAGLDELIYELEALADELREFVDNVGDDGNEVFVYERRKALRKSRDFRLDEINTLHDRVRAVHGTVRTYNK